MEAHLPSNHHSPEGLDLVDVRSDIVVVSITLKSCVVSDVVMAVPGLMSDIISDAVVVV